MNESVYCYSRLCVCMYVGMHVTFVDHVQNFKLRMAMTCSIYLVIRHIKPGKKNFTIVISSSSSKCGRGMENHKNVIFNDS
jgi:hypothetical protein